MSNGEKFGNAEVSKSAARIRASVRITNGFVRSKEARLGVKLGAVLKTSMPVPVVEARTNTWSPERTSIFTFRRVAKITATQIQQLRHEVACTKANNTKSSMRH